ncbi:MAG: 6-bladed beta-propeller [Bacteroidetes bacterium]|jgi:hypothetical protein|nr:6-bladed beta-propeller [Bacteroidota bacterium]
MRYTLIFLLALFISCQHDIKPDTKENIETESDDFQNVEQIKVDLDNVEQDLLMSDFFSNLSYIPLQVPENEYVGQTEKIIITDDYIALFDKLQYSVWIFTHKGEYINKVQIPQGKGPGEIMHFSDVIITQDHLVRAMGALKIVVYNFEGELIEETEMDFLVYKFTFDNETGEYIGYADNKLNIPLNNEHTGSNLIYFDSAGNITKSLMPIGKGKQHISFGVPNNFPVYRNNQRFFSHLENIIYTIEGDSVMPEYYLDFGAYTITDEVFERRTDYSNVVYEWVDFWKNEIVANNYVSHLFFFNETESFIHFRFATANNQHNAIYNKITKQVVTGPKRFTNDIDYGYVPFIYESFGNSLYTIIEANDLLRHLNDMYENEPEKYGDPKMERLRELGNSLNGNSNPILQIATFKDEGFSNQMN